MSRFRFIWVGKPARKQPEQDIGARYLKRTQGFINTTEQVIKPMTSSNPAMVRERDSTNILSKLQPQEYVILCDERGKQLTSPELARHIEKCFSTGQSQITWIIGGAMGVSEDLRKRANLTLSLSKMTFPHALARIILYEQVYRALCLRSNHPYHHGE